MKNTTLKKIKNLTFNGHFYYSELIKGDGGFSEHATKYSINEAVFEWSCELDFYSGFSEVNLKCYAEDLIQTLEHKLNLNSEYLQKDSKFFNPEIFEVFLSDLDQAVRSTLRDNYEIKLYDALESAIQKFMSDNSCDYWVFTKTKQNGEKEQCEFYESDSISFGYTAKQAEHFDSISYNLPGIDFSKLIDPQWEPYVEQTQINDLFLEYNETVSLIQEIESVIQRIKTEYSFK